MPVIGYLVKALDSLPVYRKQDEGEGSNQEPGNIHRRPETSGPGRHDHLSREGVSHNAPDYNQSRLVLPYFVGGDLHW